MENIKHVSHSPINSQGVEVDTLPATHLKTQSRKSKLVFPLRKFSMRGKKKQFSLNLSLETPFSDL